MRLNLLILSSLLLSASPDLLWAQTFGGAAIFEPEIDVINSGAKLDAQATVSADRKYVTMTLRPQLANLQALRTFAFQLPAGSTAANGTVGGVNPVPAGAAGAIPQAINAPMRLLPGHGGALLMRRGITPIVLE